MIRAPLYIFGKSSVKGVQKSIPGCRSFASCLPVASKGAVPPLLQPPSAVFGLVSRSSSSSSSSNNSRSGGGRRKSTRKPSLQEILLSQVLQEEAHMKTIDKEYEDMREIVLEKFKIVYEAESFAVVHLQREMKGEVIKVEFNVQEEGELNENFDPSVDLKGTNFDEDASDEKDLNSLKTGINFKVKITKADPADKSCIIFNCVATSELAVSAITCVSDRTNYIESEQYNGPVLENLDDRLKGAIIAYLNERGIDEDLNYFVGAHSIYKEQQEYVSWLKSHMTFVQ